MRCSSTEWSFTTRFTNGVACKPKRLVRPPKSRRENGPLTKRSRKRGAESLFDRTQELRQMVSSEGPSLPRSWNGAGWQLLGRMAFWKQVRTQNGVIAWIDHRLPTFTFLRWELHEYPTPRNLNYLWNFGSLSGICLVIMIVTGIALAMHCMAGREPVGRCILFRSLSPGPAARVGI